MSKKSDIMVLVGAALMIGTSGFALHMANQKPEKDLIGFSCGSDRLTLTAYEEDEFPVPCVEIQTVEQACGGLERLDGEEIKDADECAAYWGDAY